MSEPNQPTLEQLAEHGRYAWKRMIEAASFRCPNLMVFWNKKWLNYNTLIRDGEYWKA